MKLKYCLKLIFMGGLWLVLATGCAINSKRAARSLRIPPGLDSATVVRADRLANDSFVSARREREAQRLAETGKQNLTRVDEFWAYLEKRVKKNRLSDVEQAQFNREVARGAQALSRWKGLNKNAKDVKAGKAALQYCLQAQDHLEKAIRINPFDKNARLLLAVVYYNLQHIFGLEQNYQKAVEILERLTRIEKGEHDLFRMLAENYMQLKNYKKALENFSKAETVFINTSFASPPDTSTLFYYAYMQGDMQARLYNAAGAMQQFKLAKMFARAAQEKSDVENYMKWINWDAGNIRAAEIWDKILALEANKNYAKMAQLCAKLIPQLATRKAKLAVHHKLAVVEFEFLNQKDKAIERMRRVYEALGPKARRKRKSEEVQQYLNTYGAMLYRLGIEALDQQQKKLALAYFSKSVEFEWDKVARSFIELVSLLWNSPQKAIFFGERALAYADGALSKQESCQLLSMMVKAHKSAGLYRKAREYFNKWKQCQE